MLELFITKTVLSEHYIDQNYEVNKTGLTFKISKKSDWYARRFLYDFMKKKHQKQIQAHENVGFVTLIEGI